MIKAYAKYILALMLFGSNGIVASQIHMNSHEIVFWRTLIGSIFLVGMYLLAGGRFQAWKNRKHFLLVIISGITMGISWLFLFEAYAQIGVSVSTLAYYCGPAIVLALSPLVFRERLSAGKIIGFAAVLAGMVFVNGRGVLQIGISWGLFCGIMSAALFALMVIFNKKATRVTGLENATIQLVSGFITVAIFAAARHGVAFVSDSRSLYSILFLGLVNTGIGCYLYFSSMDELPAGTVAIIGYLDVLSALIMSALFLHERLSGTQTVGAALILGGAVFGELFRGRKARSGSTDPRTNARTATCKCSASSREQQTGSC